MTPRAGFVSGLIAAALAALPAALRFEPGLVWPAFVVCTAGCALVMAPLSAALAAPGVSTFRTSLMVGGWLAALPLLPLATLLKTTTHHRPLGGVTFAVMAGLTIVALSLICGRFITWSSVQPGRSALVRLIPLPVVVLGAAAILFALAHGLRGGGAYQTGFYDALRVLALATLAARLPLPEKLLRRVHLPGLAAWVAVVTVGVCLARAPAMQAELASRCPVLHWPLVWLGG